MPKKNIVWSLSCRVSPNTMLSPLVSWFLSSSSSSSSSTEEEEQSLDIDNATDESDHENNNMGNAIHLDQERHQNDILDDHENDHNYPSSCDVDNDAIPLALAVPDPFPAVTVAFPPAADERTTTTTAAAATIVTRSKRQRTANYSGTLRQYQRLWTKQDEVELLKGYLDYMKQNKGATNSLQNDVASFYDDVRHKLNAAFNVNQLVEKLRRLKRKHKVAMDKGNSGKEASFKSPQDEAIFELSNKIWGNDADQGDSLDGGGSGSGDDDDRGKVKVKTEQVENCDQTEKRALKRSRLSEREDGDAVAAASAHIQGFIEETMRSCFSPLMKELLGDAREEPSKPVELWPGEAGDEEWRKRRISELEVYLNRLGLLQDRIKAKLEELTKTSP